MASSISSRRWRCCYPTCKTYQDIPYRDHCFPRDECLRNMWVAFIQEHWPLWKSHSDSLYMCSYHFKEVDYKQIITWSDGKMQNATSRILKKGTVPTVHRSHRPLPSEVVLTPSEIQSRPVSAQLGDRNPGSTEDQTPISFQSSKSVSEMEDHETSGDFRTNQDVDTPYTVVVQVPHPYGENEQGMTEEPIYVYGDSENDQERMAQLYETSIEVQNEGQGDDETVEYENAEGEEAEEDHSKLVSGVAPLRIISHLGGKSIVWNHFGFVPLGDSDEADRRRVICRLCLTEVPYSNNTTNLQFHLRRYHRGNLPLETAEAAKRWKTFDFEPKTSAPANLNPQEASVKKCAKKPRKRLTAFSSPTATGMEVASSSGNGETYWHTVPKNQLCVQIAKALVTDCLPVSCIEGPGLQSLMKMLDVDFDSKTVESLRSQVLPQMHLEAKKEVCNEVSSASSISVSFEAWRNNEVNLNYIGITCHYPDMIGNVNSNYVKTIELTQAEDPKSVSDKISRAFAEIPINAKAVLTGCTVTEQSEGLLGLVNSAVDMLQIPRIPCLPSAFQQACSRLLQVSSVDVTMRKIKNVVKYIHKHSELRLKYHEKMSECSALLNKNIAFVLLYQGLRKVLDLNDIFTDVIVEIGDDKSVGPLDEKDYATISVVINVLQPFMDSAETISGENFPSISIVLPLLYKVANMALAESEDDNPLASDLKHSTKNYLKSIYSRDQNQLYLQTAMYLDPRLKTLPFFTEDEKHDIQNLLRMELTKVIKKSGVSAHAARVAPTFKKPRLSSLLGDMFPGVPESSNLKDSSSAFADNIARSEITCYDSEDAVSLDETQPLKWWKAREGQYKFLSKMARKLLCIPSTSIPTKRFLTAEGIRWAERRAMLPPEDVADVVFLGEIHSQG